MFALLGAVLLALITLSPGVMDGLHLFPSGLPLAGVKLRLPHLEAFGALLPPGSRPGSLALRQKPAEPAAPPRLQESVEAPAARPKPRLPAKARKLRAVIKRCARRYGLEEKLVLAVIQQESGFDAGAVSADGARGLMQLMPGTAALMGARKPFDPEQNIAAGVKFLKQCLDRFDQDVGLALAAYNAGPGNVEKYEGCPPFPETRKFVQRVMEQCYGQDWQDNTRITLPAAVILAKAESG